MNRASTAVGEWRDSAAQLDDIAAQFDEIAARINEIAQDVVAHIVLGPAGQTISEPNGRAVLSEQMQTALATLEAFQSELSAARQTAGTIAAAQESHRDQLRLSVDRELASRGLDAAGINEMRELSRHASLLGSYNVNLASIDATLAQQTALFTEHLQEREGLVIEQRDAFDRVLRAIEQQFAGDIVALRVESGRREPLSQFISDLGQRGITRWWNDRDENSCLSPQELLTALEDDKLEDIGMSSAVQSTLKTQLTPAIRRKLAALRCPDNYVLQSRMDDGTLRSLQDLSGGQKVNILLSLLLEATDERPLVIDQPEDALDKRFLFDRLLPLLGRLKGKRQIIVATHDANLVVNGDADQIIHLEASANRGCIATSGAIEDPAVRDAIVQTVDGGDEAFRLRKIKYGF